MLRYQRRNPNKLLRTDHKMFFLIAELRRLSYKYTFKKICIRYLFHKYQPQYPQSQTRLRCGVVQGCCESLGQREGRVSIFKELKITRLSSICLQSLSILSIQLRREVTTQKNQSQLAKAEAVPIGSWLDQILITLDAKIHEVIQVAGN